MLHLTENLSGKIMTDDQFNQLFNALTELLDGIKRVEDIFSERKQNEPKSTLDECKIKESRV